MTVWRGFFAHATHSLRMTVGGQNGGGSCFRILLTMTVCCHFFTIITPKEFTKDTK